MISIPLPEGVLQNYLLGDPAHGWLMSMCGPIRQGVLQAQLEGCKRYWNQGANLDQRFADDLCATPQGSPCSERLIASTVQWAERIIQRIDDGCRGASGGVAQLCSKAHSMSGIRTNCVIQPVCLRHCHTYQSPHLLTRSPLSLAAARGFARPNSAPPWPVSVTGHFRTLARNGRGT
jgi:hypothetical protein